MTIPIGTALGPARAHVTDGGTRGSLVLGHGAGGGVDSADLVEVTTEAAAAGWRVVRVEQPWRVAGRKIAVAAPKLDEAWTAVLEHLRHQDALPRPLVLGGRSAGARVACRTAAAEHADGVLALSFPLHPPGRPEKSRATELTGVTAPICVVQGETDAMGRPDAIAAVLSGRPNASVYAVAGDHALTTDVRVVAAAAMTWLDQHL